jgi:DGQHR domain-containing protein
MIFKAFDLSREGVGFYLTAMDASTLFNLSRVERVSDNPDEGFQRQLDEHRARKISNYLKSKVIPGAIILSARDGDGFSYNEETFELSFPDDVERMLVIDGQHRLYGAKKSWDDNDIKVKLPVCILTKLTHIDEINYFIDINSTQKGVPKTLRIELTKFLVEAESIDEIRLRLFKDLNSDPSSVLCGKLSAEQRGPGYLSHVPFEIAINKILTSNRMDNLDYEGKKTLLKNYLKGIYDCLMDDGNASKITQSAFFQAIFRVFDKACENTLTKYRNYKSESF